MLVALEAPTTWIRGWIRVTFVCQLWELHAILRWMNQYNSLRWSDDDQNWSTAEQITTNEILIEQQCASCRWYGGKYFHWLLCSNYSRAFWLCDNGRACMSRLRGGLSWREYDVRRCQKTSKKQKQKQIVARLIRTIVRKKTRTQTTFPALFKYLAKSSLVFVETICVLADWIT